jgi:hypothetical protein
MTIITTVGYTSFLQLTWKNLKKTVKIMRQMTQSSAGNRIVNLLIIKDFCWIHLEVPQLKHKPCFCYINVTTPTRNYSSLHPVGYISCQAYPTLLFCMSLTRLWTNLRYYPGICLGKQRKPTKTSHDSRSQRRYLNTESPEYEGALKILQA